MPRANAMVPPDAIRIEDEVWQEAFTRREPARPSRERRLRSVQREHPDWLLETTGNTLADTGSWSVPRRGGRERADTASAGRRETVGATPRADAATVTSEWSVAPIVDRPELVAVPADPPVAVAPVASSPGERVDVAATTGAVPERRTIKIQGRGAERNLPLPDSSRRRPPGRVHERPGFRPDRLAMWAVMLGFLLVLVAIISAHG